MLVALSLGAISFLGLPLSIDFTGGSLVEVVYENQRPALDDAKNAITNLSMGPYSLRESGEAGFVLRTRTLSPEEHERVLEALSFSGTEPVTPLRFTSIGPSLGSELATKALIAFFAVIASIVIYIAWAFRKVSQPVSSFIYGGTVVLILLHDLLIPLGFFSVYAFFTGAQVDTLVVVALLAVLGYSVNDTIVIFDRVRERLNLLKTQYQDKEIEEPFEKTVAISIEETFTRSINTSLTTVLALLALALFGPASTLSFTLVLLVGVIAGTYSSILVAAPLLIPLAKKFVKKDNTK